MLHRERISNRKSLLNRYIRNEEGRKNFRVKYIKIDGASLCLSVSLTVSLSLSLSLSVSSSPTFQLFIVDLPEVIIASSGTGLLPRRLIWISFSRRAPLWVGRRTYSARHSCCQRVRAGPRLSIAGVSSPPPHRAVTVVY